MSSCYPKVPNTKINWLKLASILAGVTFISLFTACGFQSAKPLHLDESFQPIQFSARDPLEVTLKRQLLKHGISLFDTSFKKNQNSSTSSSAKSRIVLSNISRQQRNYSVSLDGKNAEYLLILSADVLWKTSNDKSPDNTLFQERLNAETIIYGNPANPSAELSEIRQARKLLRQQFSRDIIALIRSNSLQHQ